MIKTNNQKPTTRPSIRTTINQQFITRLSNRTMKKQQTQTPLLARPSTFIFPTNYYTIQRTLQPLITRPYLPIQYPQQQQKISLQELNFIPMYFPIITVTLTDQFMDLLANQTKFSTLHLMYIMALNMHHV